IKMQTSSRLKSGSAGSGTINSEPHAGQSRSAVAIRPPLASAGRGTHEHVRKLSGAALTLRLARHRSRRSSSHGDVGSKDRNAGGHYWRLLTKTLRRKRTSSAVKSLLPRRIWPTYFAGERRSLWR